MCRLTVSRGSIVALAAVLSAVLVAQIAIAGGVSDSSGPRAKSASLASQLRKLKQRVATLEARQAAQGPQGPEGPRGPAGPAATATACQGNGSGDTMVSAGAVCIDKYEVSVWSSPTGGTQYGASTDNYPCSDNGQNCTNIYARSVAGVTPSRFITWFQAQQALANSGKRLPTNAEWQQAVAGTPDSTSCNVSTGVVASTGANGACISGHGANDMVGNLGEWVADWDEVAGACGTWSAGFGGDFTCLGRADTQASTGFPAAPVRGGSFGDGASAGPFAVWGFYEPSVSTAKEGFRGAR